MNNNIRILHVEDSQEDAELTQYALRKSKFNVEIKVVDSEKAFMRELYQFSPDLVISDHTLPSFNSIEALRLMHKAHVDVPFIILTGSIPEEMAIQCTKMGANDYILKSNMIRLPHAVEKAMLHRELRNERRTAKHLNLKLLRAYEEIDIKNKDIISSIGYASRILKAMLPGTAKFRQLFPSSFIMHRPKEIIGGDFYFFSEVENGFVVAAADCTGHGVPGALISMIGYHILNDIVVNRKVTRPAEILSRLNRGMNISLQQNEGGDSVSDGMDISICFVNTVTNTVEFAGANHTLYFFTRGRMFEIRSDKQTVGGVAPECKFRFASHKLRFEKGDRMYISSDGYSDQFGGEKGKRMMRKRFAELLEYSTGMMMNEQGEFMESEFEKWQGNLEQTDDVLLIGMEL